MKIKIKSILMGAIATSAMLGGMAFGSSSAQAIRLKNGSLINIGGEVFVERLSQTDFNLLFEQEQQFTSIGSSTTSPFVNSDPVELSNLLGVTLGQNIGNVTPFIRDINLNDNGDTEVATFNLIRATLERDSNDPDFDLSIFGEFVTSAGPSLGLGNLTFQFAGDGLVAGDPGRATSFSSSLEVVPTPAAVLPALLGMGTAAFRKKKHEDEEELAIANGEEA